MCERFWFWCWIWNRCQSRECVLCSRTCWRRILWSCWNRLSHWCMFTESQIDIYGRKNQGFVPWMLTCGLTKKHICVYGHNFMMYRLPSVICSCITCFGSDWKLTLQYSRVVRYLKYPTRWLPSGANSETADSSFKVISPSQIALHKHIWKFQYHTFQNQMEYFRVCATFVSFPLRWTIQK